MGLHQEHEKSHSLTTFLTCTFLISELCLKVVNKQEDISGAIIYKLSAVSKVLAWNNSDGHLAKVISLLSDIP